MVDKDLLLKRQTNDISSVCTKINIMNEQTKRHTCISISCQFFISRNFQSGNLCKGFPDPGTTLQHKKQKGTVFVYFSKVVPGRDNIIHHTIGGTKHCKFELFFGILWYLECITKSVYVYFACFGQNGSFGCIKSITGSAPLRKAKNAKEGLPKANFQN